ncbi:MAG: glucose-6-phosphate isomerase [Eubacteriales bacterium]
MLKLDTKKALDFLPKGYVETHLPALEKAAEMLSNGSGKGGEFTGWVNLPENYDKDEFSRIQTAAKKIQKQSEVLVVIGIGGSYLGSKAVIDMICSPNYNLKKGKNTPDIFFAGNGLSSDALLETIDLIGDRDFSINVISKSGTTTEPAVAFRIFKELLEKKYGVDEAADRIYATTDKSRGALKKMADEKGYETFVVPDNVGGRFSVLTAVGLLPIAVAGVDIAELMAGAGKARTEYLQGGKDNVAWQYAAARFSLLSSGKNIEMLACYQPNLRFFCEWWKQLFGESEGKDGKGLFPASVEFTADLHSMGQYIQDGQRIMFETVIDFAQKGKVEIPNDPADSDGLNFLAGKDLSFVAENAMAGTALAHVDGGVPNISLMLPQISADSVGYAIYFFEYVCGLTGYLMEVNPFDQPGVEAYKNNMYALLGKTGYEDLKKELKARL